MKQQIQSTVPVEINLTVIGKFIPGTPERGPTYNCSGEPGEPNAIEDVKITGAVMGVINPEWRYGQPLMSNPTKWINKSILEGVNVKSPDVVKLLANIAALAHDDIEGALMDEVIET